jgi:uncharacterized spore protein YtfJ
MSTTEATNVLDSLRQAVDAGRAFGTPVAGDGVLVLPVVKIGGVGGGGGGTGPSEPAGQPQGVGGGFGTSTRGIGVFVIKDGKVSWRPAVDVNRIVLGGQLVAITALLVARSVLRHWMASAREQSAPVRVFGGGRAGAAGRPRRGGTRAYFRGPVSPARKRSFGSDRRGDSEVR